MPSIHARTTILLGDLDTQTLRQKHILIAGIGGVGGYVAENLARAGIGQLTLLDGDVVAPSNLNRQLVALKTTIGQKKTAVMKARIADIDSKVSVKVIDEFMSVDRVDKVITAGQYDMIADCIDSIACKAELVAEAQKRGIAIISAMGAGNRMDVSKVKISTLEKTTVCPLARQMRRRLRDLAAHLDYSVIFSDEAPRPPLVTEITEQSYTQKATNGTISYMPAVFGVLMAGEIIQKMLKPTKV